MPDGTPMIDPDIIAGRISALLHQRRPGAVKPLLAALEKLAPGYRDLLTLRVSYLSLINCSEEALSLLDGAISESPGSGPLYLKRGEIFYALGSYAEAAADAASAILAEPGLIRAKGVLGLALFNLGDFDQALPCLSECFAAVPSAVDVALAFAMLVPEQAVRILRSAIGANPRLSMLRNALMRHYIQSADYAAAIQEGVCAEADGVADVESFCLIAFAQIEEKQWAEAERSVGRARRVAPSYAWADRLSVALTSRLTGILGVIEDTDAAQAERRMIRSGVVFPRMVHELLVNSAVKGPVLDLYCGTGLNAITAREAIGGTWIGVEPVAAWGALCAERGLYDRFEHADPLNFLTQSRGCAVVLLNEAFAQVAEARPLLGALRAALATEGLALAAIPSGAGLTGHGLFGHDAAEIAELAGRCGLSFTVLREGVLRYAEGIPVRGIVVRFSQE